MITKRKSSSPVPALPLTPNRFLLFFFFFVSFLFLVRFFSFGWEEARLWWWYLMSCPCFPTLCFSFFFSIFLSFLFFLNVGVLPGGRSAALGARDYSGAAGGTPDLPRGYTPGVKAPYEKKKKRDLMNSHSIGLLHVFFVPSWFSIYMMSDSIEVLRVIVPCSETFVQL